MIKQIAGLTTSLINPQCRFDRTLFLLGHMRCGSTALSHILCGHPEVSGYGEAHIRYDTPASLGILAINQLRRNALRPKARCLFDKILHSRYDGDPHPDFFQARAIFLVREPVATILSIRKLFRFMGTGEYATDAQCADYYEERLDRLVRHWNSFPSGQRTGFSFDSLTSDPDTAIMFISKWLDFTPPLTNRYAKPPKVIGRGAGDPLSSHRFDGIVGSAQSTTLSRTERSLDMPPGRIDRLTGLYDAARREIAT